MNSLAKVAQTPVASAENAQRLVGAQPPRGEDEVEEVDGAAAKAIAVVIFPGGPNSPSKFASLHEVKLGAALLIAQVGNGHQLDVKKMVERWVREHTNSSYASPLEITVLNILLTSFLEEVKVHTKLTEYGTRFLLVLTAGENLCENISDVVNLVDLYFRGKHVFFGLSLGCVMLEILVSCAFVFINNLDLWDYVYAVTTSYPCIWLYRYATGEEPPEDCAMSSENIMFIAMSFKSNIVSFLQALISLVFLLTSRSSLTENSIQVVSLSLSLLMMAVSQVGLAYEYEITISRENPQSAKKGHHYGIFPNFHEKPWQCAFCLIGLFFAILASCIGTLFAFTAVAIAFGVWVPFVIVGTEGATNVIAQACRGQLFRANLVGDHSSAVRMMDAILFHFLMTYSGMAIVPTIQWRSSEIVGGAYFTMGCMYAKVRDFVLLALVYNILSTKKEIINIDQSLVLGIGIALITTFISGALLFFLMMEEGKAEHFFSTETIAQHQKRIVKEVLAMDTSKYYELKIKGIEVDKQTYLAWYITIRYTGYLPEDLIRKWIKDNIARWNESRRESRAAHWEDSEWRKRAIEVSKLPELRYLEPEGDGDGSDSWGGRSWKQRTGIGSVKVGKIVPNEAVKKKMEGRRGSFVAAITKGGKYIARLYDADTLRQYRENARILRKKTIGEHEARLDMISGLRKPATGKKSGSDRHINNNENPVETANYPKIIKRTFEKVYDNRESGKFVDKIFEEVENEIAIDPDNKSDAVKRIVTILKEVSKASLPALRRASVGALVRGLIGVILQYGDTSSDVIVTTYLHNAGIYWARDIMIVAICLNLLFQTAAVYIYNQPITELGLIFTMLKPAADMVRVVTNAKVPEGQTDSFVMTCLTTRNIEVLFESIPCTILQAILLSQQGGLAANPLQTTSMVIGLVATSYAVADSHVDLDQSRVSRLDNPDLHCLIKDDGSNQAQFTVSYVAAVFFFILCKICTVLLVFNHAASPAMGVAGWIGGEYVIFWAYLFVSNKIWPANVTTGLGFVEAGRIWLWNTCALYLGSCVVPGIQNRFSLLLGGKAFTTVTILSTVGNVAVATAMFVTLTAQSAIAAPFGNTSTTNTSMTNTSMTNTSMTNTTSGSASSAEDASGSSAMYAVVVVTAALFLAFFALMLSTLSDKARKTFFLTESARERAKLRFNNFGRNRWTVEGEDVTEEEFKAYICLFFHPSFLPTADVCSWIEANRERWDREKPEFWKDQAKRKHMLDGL